MVVGVDTVENWWLIQAEVHLQHQGGCDGLQQTLWPTVQEKLRMEG